jgi:hypothetical protein
VVGVAAVVALEVVEAEAAAVAVAVGGDVASRSFFFLFLFFLRVQTGVCFFLQSIWFLLHFA